METNDPVAQMVAYLEGGTPVGLTAIAADIGLSRQHTYTLVRKVEQATGCKIPKDIDRRRYTSNLLDLMRALRQSSLPLCEALEGYLRSLGLELPITSRNPDPVAELTARVRELETTMREVIVAFEEVSAWAHLQEERLAVLEVGQGAEER